MVIWTEPAKIDLKHIHDFIAEDSKRYAKKVVAEVIEQSSLLGTTPKLGKVVPELHNELIREVHLYSYRILYEIKDTNVEILAVIHKRRDFKASDLP